MYKIIQRNQNDDPEKLALKNTVPTLSSSVHQDVNNKNTFIKRKYDGYTFLGKFVDNLKNKSFVQSSWDAILRISSSTSSIMNNILIHNVIITEN